MNVVSGHGVAGEAGLVDKQHAMALTGEEHGGRRSGTARSDDDSVIHGSPPKVTSATLRQPIVAHSGAVCKRLSRAIRVGGRGKPRVGEFWVFVDGRSLKACRSPADTSERHRRQSV